MKKYLGWMLLALTVPALLVAQDQKNDASVGVWKLDVAKSKFTPGPPPQSVTVTIAEGGKVTVDQVAPDGRQIKYSFTISEGTAVPIEGMENSTITAKRIDDRHVEHIWKFGDHTLTGKGTIAKDGKSMIYVLTGTNSEGKQVHNVEHYDKQ